MKILTGVRSRESEAMNARGGISAKGVLPIHDGGMILVRRAAGGLSPLRQYD